MSNSIMSNIDFSDLSGPVGYITALKTLLPNGFLATPFRDTYLLHNLAEFREFNAVAGSMTYAKHVADYSVCCSQSVSMSQLYIDQSTVRMYSHGSKFMNLILEMIFSNVTLKQLIGIIPENVITKCAVTSECGTVIISCNRCSGICSGSRQYTHKHLRWPWLLHNISEFKDYYHPTYNNFRCSRPDDSPREYTGPTYIYCQCGDKKCMYLADCMKCRDWSCGTWKQNNGPVQILKERIA